MGLTSPCMSDSFLAIIWPLNVLEKSSSLLQVMNSTLGIAWTVKMVSFLLIKKRNCHGTVVAVQNNNL
jgi:hypothetical protein